MGTDARVHLRGLWRPCRETPIVLAGCPSSYDAFDRDIPWSQLTAPIAGAVRISVLSYEAGLQDELGVRLSAGGQPLAETMTLPLDGPEFASIDWGFEPTRPPSCEGREMLVTLRSDHDHAERIAHAKRLIGDGDVYQLNVTRTLAAPTLAPPEALYATLAGLNPVPHEAFVQTPRRSIISNSMETLLTYDASGRRVASYPIKGTALDADNSDEAPLAWRQSEKERAEHVMIVDLVRNDLGRVCVPRSIEVSGLMKPHRFRWLWHGISEVGGVLRPDASMTDALRSLFPGGSIIGAPKVRAAKRLRELEPTARGAYTGSILVVWPDGSAVASILIRTLVHDLRGWTLGVGGGIVFDSEPAAEVAETWLKARVFQDALAVANAPSSQPACARV